MAEDISKLPKWAQTRIRVLEDNLAAERTMSEALGGVDGDTNVFVGPYFNRHPLPRDSIIEFVLSPYYRLRVRHDGRGGLEVMALGGAISIRPQVTNVIVLKEEKL